ncbi:uncharacterized protein LOC142164618 [Nicotiana tabacum]|uniref:Uncharacterized protein LOC142164618 n=1 Tax=Nicotiana tabacum TaxID=4097 RepID=A0AC58S1K4_TOBAC
MRRSRSVNNLLPLDPEIERTLHRLRKEVDARTRIERELNIVVQPYPIEMAADLIHRLFVGLPHEDLQRHIQNFLEITDTYNYQNVFKDYVRLTLFPISLIGEAKEWLNKEPTNSIRTWDDLVLRSQILGFEQRAGETLRQAWERYKKMLRDCPHHCQTDEVLGHTFVDGLDDASKMNLDLACGGSCMARPYSKIQILLNNFTANDNNWQGEGDSRKDIKQKSVGLLELDEVSAMRADIAKLANQMTRMTIQQPQPMQHVHQMAICCELCGDNHMSDMCPTNPESIYYVGQQNRGPPNQHAQYGNSYNPNWRNHPSFSWGENQQNQNQHRPQGGFNQPQNPPQQMEESTNELLKKLLVDNQQIRTDNQQLKTDFRNLERQLGHDTEKNPQVNAVTLRNGRELEEVPKKRKNKHVPEGELIPKVTNEPKKTIEIPEPVQLNIPLVDVLREIPKYAKYIKDIVSHKKRSTEFETIALIEECTSRVQNKLPQKLKDPGSFTIPVHIGNVDVGRALCNLGVSINLMPLSLFKQLGLGAPRPTTVMLQLADRSIAHPEGVIEDVLLQIGKFIFPADFIILDYEADELVPIILGRPLLATSDAIIKEEKLLRVLREHKRALGWTMSDIKGISPAFCMHKILMEDGHKPSVEQQCRLNPIMKEVTANGCMMAIFTDIVERFVEVFMDDVSIFGCSFDNCLMNLDKVLARLLEKDVVLKFDDVCLKAFEELKGRLVTAPIIIAQD